MAPRLAHLQSAVTLHQPSWPTGPVPVGAQVWAGYVHTREPQVEPGQSLSTTHGAPMAAPDALPVPLEPLPVPVRTLMPLAYPEALKPLESPDTPLTIPVVEPEPVALPLVSPVLIVALFVPEMLTEMVPEAAPLTAPAVPEPLPTDEPMPLLGPGPVVRPRALPYVLATLVAACGARESLGPDASGGQNSATALRRAAAKR